MEWIENVLQPWIGFFVMWFAALLLFSVALWVVVLQAHWSEERKTPNRISLGTINLDGSEDEGKGHLLLESWNRFFSANQGGSPNMGLAEIPALNVSDILTTQTEALNALEIDVKVGGLELKKLVETGRKLAQAPRWTLDADIHTTSDRRTMKLFLRRSSRSRGSWFVEQARAAEGDPGASNAALGRLVDEAILQFAYDRPGEHNQSNGTNSQEKPFPTSAAFGAFVRGRHHFRRYGESRAGAGLPAEDEFREASAPDTAKEHLQKAIDWFRTAAALMPDRPDIVTLLGVCLAESRNEVEAVDVYGHAIRLLRPEEEEEVEVKNLDRYVKACLLRETARGKLYTVSDLHEAVKELQTLARYIEGRLKPRSPNKELQETLQEVLAHVYIQLAHNHGRYLALMRHVRIRDMFDKEGPSVLQIDALESSDLSLVTANTLKQSGYIIDSEADPARKEVLKRQLARLLPEEKKLHDANKVFPSMPDIDLELQQFRQQWDQELDPSQLAELSTTLADSPPDIPPDLLIDNARLRQMINAAQAAFQRSSIASRCPGCDSLKDQIDEVSKIADADDSQTGVSSSEDRWIAIEAVGVRNRMSADLAAIQEAVLAQMSAGLSGEYKQKLDKFTPRAVKADDAEEGQKCDAAVAISEYEESRSLRKEVRATGYSEIAERQMRGVWPTTKNMRDVYRSLYEYARESEQRSAVIDEDLQELLRAAQTVRPRGPSDSQEVVTRLSRKHASIKEGLQKILPDSKTVVTLAEQLLEKVLEEEPLHEELAELTSETGPTGKLSFKRFTHWSNITGAITFLTLKSGGDQRLMELRRTLTPTADSIQKIIEARTDEREEREKETAKKHVRAAKNEQEMLEVSQLVRLNELLASTEQQTIVRSQVRKLWITHHYWLQKAKAIMGQLDGAEKSSENANRNQNLTFQYELAAGYTNYRLAAWLDESWNKERMESLFPLQRDLPLESPAGKKEIKLSDVSAEIKTFKEHCEQAISALRRANGAGPDRYHVQQYLGLVYGDPRFDPDGKRSELAEEYLKRSIQLEPNTYYSREQLAVLLRRKVNRIGVVEDAYDWIERGIQEADESTELRPLGAGHVYRAELRAMAEEFTNLPADATLANVSPKFEQILSQAEQFSGAKIGIEDPGFRWLKLMREVRVHAATAKELLEEIKPVNEADGDPGAEPGADDAKKENAEVDQANQKKKLETWKNEAKRLHARLGKLIRDCHILENVWVVQEFVFEVKQRRLAAERLEEAMESTQFDQLTIKRAADILKAWGKIDPIDRWRFPRVGSAEDNVD